MSIERFWEIYDEQLEFIDQVLSSRGTPIPRRPWETAFFFLEHCILEVSGMAKSEVVTHPMFRDMIQHGRRWYIERYGESLVEEKGADAVAMLELFDTPFELRFPLTVTQPARRKGVTALRFPRRVLRSEDSLTFLAAPPNLQRITPRERATIRRRVSRVVALARQLHVDAMFVDVGREDGAALAAGIRISLEKGVRDVCSAGTDRLSAAIWEFNFAAEKALKTLLWQQSKPVPKTHDIKTLVSKAVARGLTAPPRRWVETFPGGVDAVRYRYGELGVPSISGVMDLYAVALRLSVHCARAFQRTISIIDPGAVIYLKSPWDRTSDKGSRKSEVRANGV